MVLMKPVLPALVRLVVPELSMARQYCLRQLLRRQTFLRQHAPSDETATSVRQQGREQEQHELQELQELLELQELHIHHRSRVHVSAEGRCSS